VGGGDQRGPRAARPGAGARRPRRDQPTARGARPADARPRAGGVAAAADAGGRRDRGRAAHPARLDLPLRRHAAARLDQRRAAGGRRPLEPAGHAPLRRRCGDQRGLRAAQPHVALDRAGRAGCPSAVPRAASRAAHVPRDQWPAHRVPRSHRAGEGPGAPRPRLPGAARPRRAPAHRGRLHPRRRWQRDRSGARGHRRRSAGPAARLRARGAPRRVLRLAGRVHPAVGERLRGVRHCAGGGDAGRRAGALQRHPGGAPARQADRLGFGTLVPPADEAAITRGLQELYTNPPDREVGSDRARRAFSVSNVLDTYEVLLDKAAPPHAP
jgi:hypothetical protein